jgi:hypothetical protein
MRTIPLAADQGEKEPVISKLTKAMILPQLAKHPRLHSG